MSEDERRRYRRLDTEVKVEISYTDPERDITSLITDPVSKNMSAGGLLIRHKSPLAVGSEVVVKFLLPSEQRYIMTFGKVVRVEMVEEGSLYEIGLCFVNTRQQDIERIEKHVTNSLEKG